MRRIEMSKLDERAVYDKQARATAHAMAIELARAEHKIDTLRAELSASRILMGSALEEERAKVVAHLRAQAIKRMLKIELARSWTSWTDTYKRGRRLKRRALLRFRQGELNKALSTWAQVRLPPFSYPLALYRPR
jgi:hypothetical protein